MADPLTLERFRVGTAQDWNNWLEDYCAYGQLKKWNTEKLIANLRFFVSGEVKDCVRQVCAASPSATLETIATEVSTLLGGTPDPLIAIHVPAGLCVLQRQCGTNATCHWGAHPAGIPYDHG